jgi:hypothetical protein
MTTIGGIKVGESVTVRIGDVELRDMYGGAVRVGCRWEGDDGSWARAEYVDLEAEGVQQVIDALTGALQRSCRAYAAAQTGHETGRAS